MVRLQTPGPPASSGDGRANWRRSWPTIPWPGRRIPKLGSAANANQGAKIGSDSGFSFSSAFSQRIGAGPQDFPVAQPELLSGRARPVWSVPGSGAGTGPSARRCCLSTSASCLRMKSSHFAWSGLTFRQILRVRFRIGGDAEEGQFVRRDGAGEDTVEGVVIARRNRIVLVIVAPRAAHRQRHRAARDDVDPVVDRVVMLFSNCRPTVRNPRAASGRLFSPRSS